MLRQAQHREGLRTTWRILPNEANAGRVAGVFGLRGELKVAASRIGDDALAPGIEVRAVLRDGDARVLRVRSLRRHQGRPLIAFDGIDDAIAAEALIGADLSIGRDAVRLARDEFFDDDLIGCTLVDAHGTVLAEVRAVDHYPAQDVVRVALPGAPPERRAIVPLVRAFVTQVDVGAKRIVVDLPRGLLNDAEADEG